MSVLLMSRLQLCTLARIAQASGVCALIHVYGIPIIISASNLNHLLKVVSGELWLCKLSFFLLYVVNIFRQSIETVKIFQFSSKFQPPAGNLIVLSFLLHFLTAILCMGELSLSHYLNFIQLFIYVKMNYRIFISLYGL
jgi:hypothetical protein